MKVYSFLPKQVCQTRSGDMYVGCIGAAPWWVVLSTCPTWLTDRRLHIATTVPSVLTVREMASHLILGLTDRGSNGCSALCEVCGHCTAELWFKKEQWTRDYLVTCFTCTSYASVVLAIALCLSVCLCLSQVSVSSKRLDVSSCFSVSFDVSHTLL